MDLAIEHSGACCRRNRGKQAAARRLLAAVMCLVAVAAPTRAVAGTAIFGTFTQAMPPSSNIQYYDTLLFMGTNGPMSGQFTFDPSTQPPPPYQGALPASLALAASVQGKAVVDPNTQDFFQPMSVTLGITTPNLLLRYLFYGEI